MNDEKILYFDPVAGKLALRDREPEVFDARADVRAIIPSPVSVDVFCTRLQRGPNGTVTHQTSF